MTTNTILALLLLATGWPAAAQSPLSTAPPRPESTAALLEPADR